MPKIALVAVFLCLIASPAQSHCDQVRAYVKEHGRAKALAHAIKHGATWKQIQTARKCLNDSRR